MPFISSFEIIKVVDEGRPELCIFFWISASPAGAAAAIPNGAKIFLLEEQLLLLMDLLIYLIMVLKTLQVELF